MPYSMEVEMIAKARKLDLLTTPYVFNRDETLDMANAGADIIVQHTDSPAPVQVAESRGVYAF